LKCFLEKDFKVGKKYQDFCILSCGQPNLEPQFTICNFKKASHEFQIIFQFSLKTGKSFFPFVENALTGSKALFKISLKLV
jgi:hypothetical protein